MEKIELESNHVCGHYIVTYTYTHTHIYKRWKSLEKNFVHV